MSQQINFEQVCEEKRLFSNDSVDMENMKIDEADKKRK